MPAPKGSVFDPVKRKYVMPAPGASIQDPPVIGSVDAVASPDAPTPTPAHVEAQRTETPDDTRPVKGMRVKLTEGGEIDWAGMKEAKTDTRLQAAILKDPKVKEFFAQRSAAFSPEAAGQMLDALVKVEGMVARFTMKVDADICEQVFQYTPEQHKQMDPVAARVMQKYTPDWLSKYQDELMFGTILLMVTRAQFDNAVRLQNHRNKYGTTPPPPATQPAAPPVAEVISPPPAPEPPKVEPVTIEGGFAVAGA